MRASRDLLRGIAFGIAPAGVLALSSCAPSYDTEVRGPLVLAVGLDSVTRVGGSLYDVLLIQTSPGAFTQFYLSPDTELINIDSVEGDIQWAFDEIHVVRGNKSQRRDPIGISGFTEAEIEARVDATYVENLGPGG